MKSTPGLWYSKVKNSGSYEQPWTRFNARLVDNLNEIKYSKYVLPDLLIFQLKFLISLFLDNLSVLSKQSFCFDLFVVTAAAAVAAATPAACTFTY